MTLVARARLLNFGLLGLALLSVWMVIWTGRVPTSAERQVRQRHLLEVFRREDVQRIEVQQGQRRTVVVRRAAPPPQLLAEPDPEAPPGAQASAGADGEEEAEWSLSEPLETDADAVPVEQLLGSLQYATWEREVDPAAISPEPNAALAAPPPHELVIGMGTVVYRLRLGQDAVSPPGARYVEVSSGAAPARTVVIKKRLVDELFVEADAFRGRQIVPYRKSSIDRVVLSSAAGVRRLKRAGNDFRFDGMQENQRVERHAVDRVFMALARARAEPFVNVEAAMAALGLGSTVRVSLVPVDTNKPEASLELGGTCPSAPDKVLAIRHLPEPLAGCVEKSVLYALREPAAVFVDRGLFSLDADEVDTVRIAEEGTLLEFARGADGFVLKAPRNAPLEAEAAQDRLARILDIEGELLMGRDRPAADVTYSGGAITLESSARLGEERTIETVRLSAPLSDGGRRILREADGAVLVVSAEGALPLRADATLLKEHKVFDYAIKDVRRVEVSYGSVKQALERSEAGALSLVSPKGYDIDGALAIELMDQLRTLRALRWVSDRASTGFGLDKPRATVHLSVVVEGRDIERTLSLGARAPGGYYASVDRDPGVFVAPRGLERVLETWLLDRAIFRADRDSVAELSLDAVGLGKVVLKRVAGELTLQKESSGFDAARIDELLDAIESLRCEAAVHLGPAVASEGLRRPILSGVIRRQSLENVGMPPIRFSIGSRDSFRGASVYYARHGSVNATYALPREQVQRLLDLF